MKRDQSIVRGCLGSLGDCVGSVIATGEWPEWHRVTVLVGSVGQVASNVEAVSLSENL